MMDDSISSFPRPARPEQAPIPSNCSPFAGLPVFSALCAMPVTPARSAFPLEQAAFNPANVVPGISFSPDKMRQASVFSYGDAQRYRVGVNHHQIPVNAPRCPVNSFHRDGQMRTDGNAASTLGYEPNSHGQWAEQPDFREPPLDLQGRAGHWNHRQDADYFSQPGALFRLMNPMQKQALFENTARSISGASAQTKQRHIDHCTQADPEYGAGVAQALERLG
jgi:catalase